MDTKRVDQKKRGRKYCDQNYPQIIPYHDCSPNCGCNRGPKRLKSQTPKENKTLPMALHHKLPVLKIFRTLLNIGGVLDQELLDWINSVVGIAYDNRILRLKNASAQNFWPSLPQVFVDEMLNFTSCRDQAEAYVSFMRDEKRNNNRFMPTNAQVDYLEKHIVSQWCLPSNWEEWIELWNTNDILYSGLKKAVQRDQQSRAKNIADMLDSQNLQGQKFTITMMDGHGRQWMTILLELQRRKYDLSLVHLRIVDINDAVNRWHKIFFPRSCATIVCSTPDEGGIYVENVPKNGILYMNFCGLGGKNSELKTRLNEFKRTGDLSRTIVSFSSRGGVNPSTYDFLKSLGKEVCCRGTKGMGFHTFSF